MLFIFLENVMNLGIFTHAPVLHSKLKAEFFENLFPPTVGEEAMICFIKFQSEKKKMNWNIRLFIFCMIYNFSRCDGLTVL